MQADVLCYNGHFVFEVQVHAKLDASISVLHINGVIEYCDFAGTIIVYF